MARLLRDGEVVAEAPLTYAGTTSTYSGVLKPPSPGEIEIEVLAIDPASVNFGRARLALTVGDAAAKQ